MARYTKLVVIIPEEFNRKLTEYRLLLRDVGVHRSKSELIINLAASCINVNIESLKDDARNPEG